MLKRHLAKWELLALYRGLLPIRPRRVGDVYELPNPVKNHNYYVYTSDNAAPWKAWVTMS